MPLYTRNCNICGAKLSLNTDTKQGSANIQFGRYICQYCQVFLNTVGQTNPTQGQ